MFWCFSGKKFFQVFKLKLQVFKFLGISITFLGTWATKHLGLIQLLLSRLNLDAAGFAFSIFVMKSGFYLCIFLF